MSNIIQQLGPLAGATRFRRISEKLYADGDAIYQHAGVNFKATWFPVYYLLSATEEKLTVTRIAQEIGFTHITVKNVLRELTQEGLVTVSANPNDGRSKIATLSKKGRNRLRQLAPIWTQISQALKSIFDEAHPDIIAILDNIDTALEAKPISERIKEIAETTNAPVP